jgi:HSP20 family molecular chaperone IbpA
MLFRSTDLLKDFERLAKGLNLGPDFDKTVEDLSTKFAGPFAGYSNVDVVRSSEQFELFIDLPGVDPATVDLTLDGGHPRLLSSRRPRGRVCRPAPRRVQPVVHTRR